MLCDLSNLIVELVLGKPVSKQLERRGNHLGARVTLLAIVRVHADLFTTVAFWAVEETFLDLLA